MKLLFSLLILIIPIGCFAQLNWQENFNQSSPFSSTNWSGDTSHFRIDTSSFLQLSASQSTTSKTLSRNSSIRFNASWEFSVQMLFNPSSSNYTKVFVWADAEKPNEIENGVFINIGGNIDDRLELGIIDNGNTSILIQSPIDLLDNNKVECRIKVRTDSNHNYTLMIDTGNWKGNQFLSIGSAYFPSQSEASSFILECFHTSTRSDKFQFDSIHALGSEFRDEDPPKLISWSHENSRSISLRFNERLDSTEVLDPAFYRLQPFGIGPSEIEFSSGASVVDLTFTQIPNDTVSLSLAISELPDLMGNEIDTLIGPFYWPIIQWGDIQISELLIDPEPSFGLPESEGIELCNLLTIPVDLSNYSFVVGMDTLLFDSLLLRESECKWITDIGFCGAIENCYEVDFPAHYLQNGSDLIYLLNYNKDLIDLASYNTEAFIDPIKKNGGWTLQKSVAIFNCPEVINWSESNDPIGGSPGEWNSKEDPVAYPSLSIMGHHFINRKTLGIVFNQPLIELDSISISLDGDTELSTNWLTEGNSILECHFKEEFQKDSLRTLRIVGPLLSCSGQHTIDTIIEIVLPGRQSSQQWIFTEVLFEPLDGNPEFIEFINSGTTYSELSGLRICAGIYGTGAYNCSDPINQQLVIMPNERILIVGETEWGELFIPDCPIKVIHLASMPELKNSGDQIFILDSNLQILHRDQYSEDNHSRLANDVEGISLCREPGEPWISSTDNNSGCRCPIESLNNNDVMTISSECVSPNNDGHQDAITIEIKSRWPSNLVNLKVVDQFAMNVTHIIQQEHMGSEHQIVWDGRNEIGRRLDVGTYFFILEMENEEHDVEKCIKSFSVCQ